MVSVVRAILVGLACLQYMKTEMCVVVVLTTANPVGHITELVDKQFVVKKQIVVNMPFVGKKPLEICHPLR
jgi:alpha-galactosidase/6-phospho-beta-glucosidase family protein